MLMLIRNVYRENEKIKSDLHQFNLNLLPINGDGLLAYVPPCQKKNKTYRCQYMICAFIICVLLFPTLLEENRGF